MSEDAVPWYDRRLEHRHQCEGKEVFDSPQAAEAGVKRMKRGARQKRRLQGVIHGYRCDFCRKWHIGAVQPRPKKIVKRRPR